MADPKKPESKPENSKSVYLPIIIIVVVLIIGSRINGVTIFGDKVETPAQSTEEKKDPYDVYRWFGAREALRLGSPVINTEKAIVRTAPAGSIVGSQKKLETGRLLEGPIEEFDTTWWRVDYVQAPDGWVQSNSMSSSVTKVRLFNIVPLVYNFYKPIGYTFLIILLILFIYFKSQLIKEEKIADRKKQLKDEQYQQPKKPLAQIVEEKPDVQKLPGFQMEEIVPVQIAEENGRWKHIQELIKSYNVNDWRQAIIEADILLEEMLDKMGYKGVTIGDKLKTIERSDFITLDRAWSGHRIRNQIAHDGSSFKLNREVAERTIKDYEEVFREFYYI